MLIMPRLGQRVEIRYNPRLRPLMPLHGRIGVVIARSTGRPRNHRVRVDGRDYAIPCGQLFPAPSP